MLMKQKGNSIGRIPIHYGKIAISVAIGIGQACILMEFACYIAIYWSMRERNKSFFQIIQEDILKKRVQTNAITFTGQAIAFIVEITYSLIMQILLHFGSVGGFFEPGALPIVLLVTMAGITSAQVLASPELRRFLQGHDRNLRGISHLLYSLHIQK